MMSDDQLWQLINIYWEKCCELLKKAIANKCRILNKLYLGLSWAVEKTILLKLAELESLLVSEI